MLKKKTLAETIYNNGDPFQIREAISACIGAWQKREDVEPIWETLRIETEEDAWVALTVASARTYFLISVESVYRDEG